MPQVSEIKFCCVSNPIIIIPASKPREEELRRDLAKVLGYLVGDRDLGT